jgi:hypothetical protein
VQCSIIAQKKGTFPSLLVVYCKHRYALRHIATDLATVDANIFAYCNFQLHIVFRNGLGTFSYGQPKRPTNNDRNGKSSRWSYFQGAKDSLGSGMKSSRVLLLN